MEIIVTLTYQERIDALRAAKLAQTEEKHKVIGSMDFDDHGLILPPPDQRKIVQSISGSGMAITDCLLAGFDIEPNHPNGGFYGPRAVGENFGRLLHVHPVYIDPVSSLAGGYHVNFLSYRKNHWKPEFDTSPLRADYDPYKLVGGIGATQHFCQDLSIGLELGWGGLLDKIDRYRQENAPHGEEFYAGLEAVVQGMQDWIRRAGEEAHRRAVEISDPFLSQNLQEMAEINTWITTEPPRTFREACQWILWYQIAARMFNGSGSLGRLDVILQPYYDRDIAAGILTDEEAIFHLACYLVRDTAYIQLGGPDASGIDQTTALSYLILEAGHRLKIPANVGVCVGDAIDPGLLHRGVEIMFEDRSAFPKFLGVERTVEGSVRDGFPIEIGRQRAYSGCHWVAVPGREYCINDCIKINLARVFEIAFDEMMDDPGIEPTLAELWRRYDVHMKRAVDTMNRHLDFHMAHMHEVYPELVLDLLCHGTIEKGLDASNGGVEITNLGLDASALATVADSFAALEQRVEQEKRLDWQEVRAYLESNWAGDQGERARMMMRSIPRYGSGDSLADDWAVRISRAFSDYVANTPTPAGFKVSPGLFSWANTIGMGKDVGATPNGRYARDPIAHGSNPDPGFRRDGAPTAMAVAIASVQPGYGNPSPMQIELDPSLVRHGDGVELVSDLVRAHFDLGGTQVNMNILDKERILAAHKDPSKFPDLVVRVTGFSAYFASLSPEFRQLVVDRILSES
jgi:pyruvate-formate lyase